VSGDGTLDIWVATRSSPTAAFSKPPEPVDRLNSDADDGDPGLSVAGTELLFCSNRPSDQSDGRKSRIWLSRRNCE
jgi:hypothetical protein